IESIREVLPYEPSLAPVIARGAHPATRIISFTVTEAGYSLTPDNKLDTSASDIAADLAAARKDQAGSSIYGAMTAILRARQAAGAGPVTLLNCDNLRHNGERFRGGLLEFIDAVGDASLLAWVQAHTTCPNAMVDRITPRPPPELRARVRQATGWDDAAPVGGENFIQWVIEDNFIAGRPEWEKVGVQLVDSVQPYEEAKIRLLNATHSCIAWAGTLIGLTTIHESTRTPAIRQMAYDYVTQDAIPCLDRPGAQSPVDLPKYRDVVLERFGNPAIRDTNQRVAADGFAKIPGMIAPTVHDCLAQGRSIEAVAVLPALFLAFLQRWHRGQLPFEYQDQVMDPAVAHAICDATDPVAALASDATLWGSVAGDERLIDALRRATKRVSDFQKDTK
ncbi:MAG: D-arabinitol 4-dehydrogenase, partial [Rhodoferax sp.]